MLSKQRWLLFVACIIAAGHQPAHSACLHVRLLKFVNRYNTMQKDGAQCCDIDCDRVPDASELKTLCQGKDQCDHAFHVSLATSKKTVDSGWSGTEFPNSVMFNNTIGRLRNDFKICQPMEDVAAEPTKQMAPVTVSVAVMDIDDSDTADFVAELAAVIDPMKTGVAYRQMVVYTYWTRYPYATKRDWFNAPFHLVIEAKVVIEDSDPAEFKNWGAWDTKKSFGLCKPRDPERNGCKLFQELHADFTKASLVEGQGHAVPHPLADVSLSRAATPGLNLALALTLALTLAWLIRQ